MPSSHQSQHRRTHNLLLISKLLSCRDNASPFTLVLDSLEQSAKPLVNEIIRRAKVSKLNTVFISFETLLAPQGVDLCISASSLDKAALHKQIISRTSQNHSKSLLIFDTLNSLCLSSSAEIPTFLSSVLSPSTSLVAVYHSDVPSASPHTANLYSPPPLVLLKYLSTTIFTTHSLSQLLAKKAARERSVAEPCFGLEEDIEGVMRGLGSNDLRGVVLEMEHRRKSGREVKEWFFLPSLTERRKAESTKESKNTGFASKEVVILLDDHPLYRRDLGGDGGTVSEEIDTTFDLSLTEKQRRDREGVVLPYFDAQRGDGPGEGGRILYEMGEEDDFDEEEDEI